MKFKIFSIIAIIFSLGLWFLNGKVLASPSEDGWRIERVPPPGNNSLKFSWFPAPGPASSSSLTLLTSGNVGIGTDSPATRLHVNGGNFRLLNSGQFDIEGTSGRNLIGSTGHLKVAFDSNNNETDRVFQIGNNSLDFSSALFTIQENGNVGIGTTGPVQPLHVMSTASDQQLRISDTGVAPTNQGRLELGYSATSSLGRIQAWKDPSTPLPLTINPGGGNVGIGTTTPSSILHIHNSAPRITLFDSDVAIGSGNPAWGVRSDQSGTFKIQSTTDYSGFTDRLVVSSNGNVGIGTGNPTSNLNISGGASSSILRHHTTNSGSNANDGVELSLDTNGNGYLWNYEAGPIIIGTNNLERVRITSTNGNVGIGLTNPTHKLQVVGTAGLSTGTAWTNTSDIRLKDIHGNYNRGLKEILELRPILFNYKKDNPLNLPSEKETSGFIAQEVQKVIPEAVSTRDDGYLELNVDPIHWAAVKAIQELYALFDTTRNEQQNQIDKQAGEIEALKQEIQNLKQQISN